MIIEGKPIIGFNFHALIRCLFIPSQKYNLTRLPKFPLALYKALVNPDIFSNNQFLTIFKSVGSSPSNLANPTKGKGILSSLSQGPISLSPMLLTLQMNGANRAMGD